MGQAGDFRNGRRRTAVVRFLALALPVLAAAPGSGLVYVMMSDDSLLAAADAVVYGEVLSSQPAPDSEGISIDYVFQVEELIKGTIPGSAVIVRQFGGARPDGLAARIAGVRMLAPGDRALLFLRRDDARVYRVVEYALGAFFEAGGERPLLVRETAMQLVVGAAGDPTADERRGFLLRDSVWFRRWLSDRARGLERPADYFAPKGRRGPVPVSVASPYAARGCLLPDGVRWIRWSSFDSGGSVGFFVQAGGQQGASDNRGSLRGAMSAWNDVPGGTVRLVDSGDADTPPPRIKENKGKNVIAFENPYDEIPGTFEAEGVVAAVQQFFDCSAAHPIPNTNRTGAAFQQTSMTTQDGFFRWLETWGSRGAFEETLTHELGHALGLDHSSKFGPIMRANPYLDGRGASLAEDDRVGVRFLYPSARLTITTDGPFVVAEGSAAVATLEAQYYETDGLVWSAPSGAGGGVDAARFTLSGAGVLAFKSAKDYENPDDADGDGTYEITVKATHTDGKTATANLDVTLENVAELTVLTGPESVDYEENGDIQVGAYRASSPQDRALVAWSLSGSDGARFSLAGGVLRFVAPPDFESPSDTGGDNVYAVTVEASDGASSPTALSMAVSVTVTDLDEAGTLTLSSDRPRMGTALAATAADPDSEPTGVSWIWERSSGPSSWSVIAGAASSSYTPAAADSDRLLRATATYSDEYGSGKTAQAATPNVVLARTLSALEVTTTNSAGAMEPAFDPEVLYYGVACQAPETMTVRLSAADADARVAVDGIHWSGRDATVETTVELPVPDGREVPIALTAGDGSITTYVVHCDDTPEVRMRNPAPLEAEIVSGVHTSEHHRGAEDDPRVVAAFSRPVVDPVSAAAWVNAEGASVVDVKPHTVSGAPANAYLFTLAPAGLGPITFGLRVDVSCASGGVCTADGTMPSKVFASRTIPYSPTEPVTASITSSASLPTGDTFTVTITFSYPVTGLAPEEIEVVRGAASNFTGAGPRYSLDIAPDAEMDTLILVKVPAMAAEDSLGNGNVEARGWFDVDTQAPELAGAWMTVDGSALTLSFDEVLDRASPPASSAFSATVGGARRSVTGVLLHGWNVVRLTLASAVKEGEPEVLVSYTPPTSNPLRDAAGNAAVAWSERQVTIRDDIGPIGPPPPPEEDPEVEASFGSSRYEVPEGRTVQVSVRLSADPERAVSIPLVRIHRGGASEADYSGVPERVTFSRGVTTRTFEFAAADDSEEDFGESVVIGFGDLPSRVSSVNGGAETTVSIEDDDTPPTAVIEVGGVECDRELCRALAGEPVAFADMSTGPAGSRRWEFGEGTESDQRRLSHSWSAPGFYEVTLRVSDGMRESTSSRVFLVESSSPAGTCESDAETLCLQDSRFSVVVDWWTGDGRGEAARVVREGTNDSGLFTFFDQDNWEILIKVLDGCALNGRVWVFGASTTDLGYSIRVADTVTGVVKEYRNEPGRPAPVITDSKAFADSCEP